MAGLLLTGGASVAAAAPADAATPAVSCHAYSCYNIDPLASGCANDAETVLVQDYKAESQASFGLEIRYSPTCAAAWLRLTVWSGNNIGFAGSAWNPGGTSVGFSGHQAPETWTAMVPATPSVQACGGTQFYVNGNWVRWYFLGCFTA